MNIKDLKTELRNSDTIDIDQVSTLEMVKLLNAEDKKVAFCVERELGAVTAAIDAISERYAAGGRIFYMGAGTSGRLGLIDSAECRPTFGVGDNEVIALMAGGNDAVFYAIEGAEDNRAEGVEDLKRRSFAKTDVLVGIAASGRTPYVIGGLEYANTLGAVTVSITCNQECEMNRLACFPIGVEVGAEALTGSTRLKAGTAQKMVLNMLSTGVMIKTGKVYSNLMINVIPSNEKLVDRAARIIQTLTDADYEGALEILKICDNNVKLAIASLLTGLPPKEAEEALRQADGHLRRLKNNN